MQYNFTKLFSASFEKNALFELHKKNISTFSEIHKLMFQGIHAVAEYQAKLLADTVRENSSFVKEIMVESFFEEKAAQQADLVKKSYKTSISAWTELTEIIGKSGKDTASIIGDHIKSSLTELKSPQEDKDSGGKRTTRKEAA